MSRRRLGKRLGRALSAAAAFSLTASTLTGPGFAQTPPPSNSSQADLSHLKYTAREGLTVRGLSPDDRGIVNGPATSFEVATVAGAGVEIAVNGTVVPVSRLGRRAEQDDGTVRYTFYGVVLAAGENDVVLTPLGADGLRGPSVTEHVWGPGAPAAIRARAVPRRAPTAARPARCA